MYLTVNFGRLERIEQRVKEVFRPPNPNLPTKEQLRDFETFIKYFYKLSTGRDFSIATPTCREPHQKTLINLVPRILSQEAKRLVINIPPRYGKTVWAHHLIAYGLAYYPDSQYLYISFSAEVAIKQTATIRAILELPEFTEIFGVWINPDFRSKHDFMTNKGGRVLGVGAGGSITSNGAGIKYCERFGGCAILDDIHKPDEVHSDPVRDGLKVWFKETFYSRVNQPDKTPIICIGQILHEDDILMNLRRNAVLLRSQDEGARKNALGPDSWESLILQGLDPAGNALDPSMHTAEKHAAMRETMEYMWWSQYQQEPQPAGGGIFKKYHFHILEQPPDNIVNTFITVDTAETSKTWNDFTVFSFWGLYRVKNFGIETDQWALHWLNCQQVQVEPKDLKNAFMDFYFACSRFKIIPEVVGIEKKSTGSTLLSILSEISGLKVINTIEHRYETRKIDEFHEEFIKRSNKIDRFLSAQHFVSSRRITFDISMKHATMCIEHLAKITANDSHLHDDIADTMSDAILMIPFMEKQVRIVRKGEPTHHIPAYKAIPDYRKGGQGQKWH